MILIANLFNNFKLKKIVAKSFQVSLTSDGWSKKNLKGLYFNTITCHFVGSDFSSNNLVLDFSNMEGRHTAAALFEKWKEILENWQINGKVISMTVDGGSDYSKASKSLGRYPLWCVCHRLHLVSKKIIKDNQFASLLVIKGKSIVTSYNNSHNLQKGMANLVNQLPFNERPKQLTLGCETRWTSVLQMFLSLTENKKIFATLKDSYTIRTFTDDEWEDVQFLTDNLNIIATLLKSLEGNACTIHLTFPQIWRLSNFCRSKYTSQRKEFFTSFHRHISFYFNINDDNVEETVKKNLILLLGSFLDPRTKGFDFIEKEDLKEEIMKQVHQEIRILNDIWGIPDETEISTRYTQAEIILRGDIYIRRINSSDTLTKELNTYMLLGKPQFEKEYDLLRWWSLCSDKFPLISRVAKIILGVPASSAPSERVFSISSLIAAPNRSSMTPTNFENAAFISLNKSNICF